MKLIGKKHLHKQSKRSVYLIKFLIINSFWNVFKKQGVFLNSLYLILILIRN